MALRLIKESIELLIESIGSMHLNHQSHYVLEPIGRASLSPW
jgi:hypothetical protein